MEFKIRTIRTDTNVKVKTEFIALFQGLTTIGKLFIVLIVKKNESIDTEINVYIKQNTIGSIALNIGKDIRDNNYGEMSTMDKNSEK